MPKKDEKGENAPCNDHTDENRKPIFLTCRGAKKSENATFSLFPGSSRGLLAGTLKNAKKLRFYSCAIVATRGPFLRKKDPGSRIQIPKASEVRFFG
jgi:hypothetical protein